jgi:hypothetical protein
MTDETAQRAAAERLVSDLVVVYRNKDDVDIALRALNAAYRAGLAQGKAEGISAALLISSGREIGEWRQTMYTELDRLAREGK